MGCYEKNTSWPYVVQHHDGVNTKNDGLGDDVQRTHPRPSLSTMVVNTTCTYGAIPDAVSSLLQHDVIKRTHPRMLEVAVCCEWTQQLLDSKTSLA